METRAAALRVVGNLMYLSETPSDLQDPLAITPTAKVWNLIEWAQYVYGEAKARLPAADAYWKYFDKEWLPKIKMWVVGDRRIPHAGQDTTAAIESFHSNMKSVLRQSRKKLLGRRMDWLIYELTGNVIEKYDYSHWSETNGFVKNVKQCQIMVSAIIQANTIPDANVILPITLGGTAFVKSSKRGHLTYAVYNPCTEWAVCECVHSQKGNICKHQVKVLTMTRPDLAEGKIVRFLGSLRGTAQGGMANLLLENHGYPITDPYPDNEVPCAIEAPEALTGPSSNRELGETWVDDFDRMHQQILKLLEMAYRHPIIARHLEAALRSTIATLPRLEAEIEAGMLHPLQKISLPLPTNDDGLGMRLRRLKDFLDTRGYRVRSTQSIDRLTQ